MKLVYAENAQWKWAVDFINNSLKKYPELVDPNFIVAGHGYSTRDENVIPFEEACAVHGVDCDELLEKLNTHLAAKKA